MQNVATETKMIPSEITSNVRLSRLLAVRDGMQSEISSFSMSSGGAMKRVCLCHNLPYQVAAGASSKSMAAK